MFVHVCAAGDNKFVYTRGGDLLSDFSIFSNTLLRFSNCVRDLFFTLSSTQYFEKIPLRPRALECLTISVLLLFMDIFFYPKKFGWEEIVTIALCLIVKGTRIYLCVQKDIADDNAEERLSPCVCVYRKSITPSLISGGSEYKKNTIV